MLETRQGPNAFCQKKQAGNSACDLFGVKWPFQWADLQHHGLADRIGVSCESFLVVDLRMRENFLVDMIQGRWKLSSENFPFEVLLAFTMIIL